MRGYYSLDPTGINAAYQEQEYVRKAEEYRFLHNVRIGGEKIRSEGDNPDILQIFNSIIDGLLFARGNATIRMKLVKGRK